ncbi:cyclic nucleotide-binding domain-containing protein [bacterium]|nr:cyclic nucleotide-binding domain-containing protein [bacterium]
MLTTVEKVIFLQDIDVFQSISTSDLAYLAAITEEMEADEGRVLFKEGDASDSMYMVIEGTVRLLRNDTEVMTAGFKDVFGTWALFDDEPRMVRAEVTEHARLLRIEKDDFIDLLADHVQITQGVFKAMVGRLRGLASRFNKQD